MGALDSVSEAAIQASLSGLMQGKTVIAIAHRLSTLRAMDRIVIVEDGRIVSHEGAWRAGVDGAQPGLIMPGTFLLGSRYFQEIAALPLRAPTAYHLWRRGIGIYRLKVSREQRARINVLGFGGGVSELFLMLAHHEGHRAIFCSGSPARRAHLEGLGDPIRFNRSDLASFGPLGTGTPGSLYLTDGRRLVVVRVLNRTGRVRTLAWDRNTDTWR